MEPLDSETPVTPRSNARAAASDMERGKPTPPPALNHHATLRSASQRRGAAPNQ
jgi:hypothetical protein